MIADDFLEITDLNGKPLHEHKLLKYGMALAISPDSALIAIPAYKPQMVGLVATVGNQLHIIDVD